jgi:hypothetical protein
MGLQERNLTKHAKIDYLRLILVEWTHVGQFADLLSVSQFPEFRKFCLSLFKYADVAQQAFSLDVGTTLHLAIPALNAAVQKLDEYYEKTTELPAYIMAMCSSLSIYSARRPFPATRKFKLNICYCTTTVPLSGV